MTWPDLLGLARGYAAVTATVAFLEAQPSTDFSWVVLAAAAVGLIVNTLVVLGVALKGGRLLGAMETSVTTLSEEVGKLRERRHDDAQMLTRVVVQLDDLERRVARLEEP